MKFFLSGVSVLLVLLGAAWLVFPETMLARWGVGSDGVGVFVARRYGAALLGYAAVVAITGDNPGGGHADTPGGAPGGR